MTVTKHTALHHIETIDLLTFVRTDHLVSEKLKTAKVEFEHMFELENVRPVGLRLCIWFLNQYRGFGGLMEISEASTLNTFLDYYPVLHIQLLFLPQR